MAATTATTDRAEHERKIRVGLQVAAALAVLTIIEYVIAVSLDNPLIWLLPFVVAKGWLILDYFMHVRSVLTEEGEH